AKQDKVYKFRMANWYPPGSSFNAAIWPFYAEQLKKASNGRIDIKVFPAEQLVKEADTWEAVVDGIADIGHVFLMDESGRFPLTEYGFLPMLWPNNRTASIVMTSLYEKYPALQNEFKDVHVLFFNINAPAQLFTKNKKVSTKEDFAGLKIQGGGLYFKYIAKQLGFTPVSFTFPEVYDALSKGTVDGNTVEWEGQYIWKWYEQTNYSLGGVNLYAFPFVLAMNKGKWDSLPDDIKQVFNQYSGVKGAEMCGSVFDSYDDASKMMIEDYAKKNNKPAPERVSPAVKDEFEKLMAPVHEQWAADMEKKGLPGNEVLEDARELVRQIESGQNPLFWSAGELPVAK
ncbi:MAG: TRAP transporter substrate-binding protein, partial [Bacteroidales bacterium]|nr:TRAP transporter substrate-binding protein [Bacteroidales bacterium]